MDKLTPWQNCLVKCHIDKMASPFLMSPWHREKPCTWAGIIYHHLPHRHIINTLTNITRTNVTQTNCHLDKKLPLDAMIGCPLSRQFFHLNKYHLDKCPLDKSYLANHAAQPSLIIRNTYFLLFLLWGQVWRTQMQLKLENVAGAWESKRVLQLAEPRGRPGYIGSAEEQAY